MFAGIRIASKPCPKGQPGMTCMRLSQARPKRGVQLSRRTTGSCGSQTGCPYGHQPFSCHNTWLCRSCATHFHLLPGIMQIWKKWQAPTQVQGNNMCKFILQKAHSKQVVFQHDSPSNAEAIGVSHALQLALSCSRIHLDNLSRRNII